MNAVAPTAPEIKKIIVAVHGIGDQMSYETAQSVAFRFCDYCNVPPAIPLGLFHPLQAKEYGFLVDAPPDSPLPGLGFAEVYWAGVARELIEQKYTIEEAKKWARTIIARLNLRARQTARAQGLTPGKSSQRSITRLIPRSWRTGDDYALTPEQYLMLEAVLDELIDAV
jgi:hypothetical protein